ncbi:hypothetical protein [Glycomyces terrestris]|uniref:SMI1/KNR4 family protein n=1 Tax=Glycomyces terrestris TaxID=2493553 RepID=A0A426V495_9ACTN|nr:hypothetical protein [Glycomyces terrestris]RRS01713.1 hypothetical protein EIW28_02840 [Glycomyces terrestris]
MTPTHRPTGAELGIAAAEALARSGHQRIAPGLTDAEFERIEAECGFEFSDDHRAFLSVGLPLDDATERPRPGWPWWIDWRAGDPEILQARVGWPVEGVLFDVSMNEFWYDDWGPRPAAMSEALALATERPAAAPRMVPVCGHRCLPAGRGTWGHPVLSMYQTDIIVYGADLLAFIEGEKIDDTGYADAIDRSPDFWRDLIG